MSGWAAKQAKKAEWAETCKMRGLELVAIADTIKILNDDDALELFKKTLPTPSLLQLQVTQGPCAQCGNQKLLASLNQLTIANWESLGEMDTAAAINGFILQLNFSRTPPPRVIIHN